MLKFALAAFALLLSPAVHAQGGSAQPAMKVISFTGQIQIKMPDGSIVGIVPGAAIPDIPAGAEVTVISGEAVLTAGGVAVEANAGDSFTYSVDAKSGQATIKVETGSVSVISGGTTSEVAAGGSANLSSSGTANATGGAEAVSADEEAGPSGDTPSNTTSPTQDINSPVSGSTP